MEDRLLYNRVMVVILCIIVVLVLAGTYNWFVVKQASAEPLKVQETHVVSGIW